MKKLLFLIALCISATSTVSAQPNNATSNTKAEREVLKKLDEWIDALKRNDGAAMERVLDPNFHIMQSDDRLMNREQEVAPVRSGEIKFENLAVEDVKVFIHGDTAIVTGIAAFRGAFQGRPFDGRERFFDVYQKRKGTWRAIASRATPIPANRKPN